LTKLIETEGKRSDEDLVTRMDERFDHFEAALGHTRVRSHFQFHSVNIVTHVGAGAAALGIGLFAFHRPCRHLRSQPPALV